MKVIFFISSGWLSIFDLNQKYFKTLHYFQSWKRAHIKIDLNIKFVLTLLHILK